MGYWRQDEQSLLPKVEPRAEDVLFFAGFYEGEGSCVPRPGKKGLAVVIPQKDPEMLYKARDFWGGSVRQYRLWQWTLCGDRARLFLQSIYPYLSARRKAQIDKSDAFTLTGKTSLETAGMSPERMALRANMTPAERRREVQKRWVDKNPDKVKAIVARFREKHRDRINAKQRERRSGSENSVVTETVQ